MAAPTTRPLELPPEMPPSLLRWTVLCAAAEGVGMTAAAGAARAARDLADGPGLAVIVAGGLVEGVALGTAQAWPLGRWLPSLRRGRYVLATVLVAGLGWAAASAPAALSGDEGGSSPSLALVLPGAAGLGLVMGAVLGAVQALALRGAVAHPWRWVSANVAAWPGAMCLIFLGASAPEADWPVGEVLLLGAVTGVAAGAALGLVSGWFLPSLSGAPVQNRAVLGVLGSRWHARLDRRVIGLEVHGRKTGRCYRFPVQYAEDARGLVVVPGHAERKSWWTNIREPATPVGVLRGGVWVPGLADLLRPGDPGYAEGLDTYLRRWPRPALPDGQPIVRILESSGNP